MGHLSILLNITGGLVLFLFAMRLLSNSLQNIIGKRIEYVLQRLTNRPYKGMFVGTFVTFLAQSSSITVLTVIGLVNAGVLQFTQGIGILLGSEIGTTVTAQLVTFKLENFYYPLMILGLILSTMSREQAKVTGKATFSFGLLLMGMELMKHAAVPLKDDPFILSIFQTLASYPVCGIIIGTIFTSLTSSSSATTSLIVILGASGALTLPTAITLMLGANIGTTVLELIAVNGMSLGAKRVAIAQALMNILGILIIFPFLKPFAGLVSMTSDDLARQIANSHTIFNVASSLFFLPLTPTLAYLTTKFAPGKIIKLERSAKYLEDSLLDMPHIAMMNCIKEITRMGKITSSMFGHIHQILREGEDNLVEIVRAKEHNIDLLYAKVFQYLSRISEHELDGQTSQRLSQLSHGIADIERTSDHLKRIARYLKTGKQKKIMFSEQAIHDLAIFVDMCSETFQRSLQSFLDEDYPLAQEMPAKMEEVAKRKSKLTSKYAKMNFAKRSIFLPVLSHLKRAAHHGDNLADIVISGI